MRVEDHWIAGPEGRLFARSWQPREPIGEARATFVLIHDSLGCVALWRDFPERLAETTGCRVVAYDRLGFGRSDAHPGSLQPGFTRAEAALLPILAEQLGLDTLVLLGHSVGGAMAVSAAAIEPGRCAAVVTIAVQAFVEDRTLASISEARVRFHQPDQLERLARHHGDKARWVRDAWTETWLDDASADWTLDADLAGLRCPLLVLHGDRDEFGSPAHPERIGRLTRGRSEIVLIEDCGHLPHRERQALVLDRIVAFLAAPPDAG